jgi:hypothetical protein
MENKKRKVKTYGLDDNGLLGVYAVSVVEFPAIEEDFVALSKAKGFKLAAVNEEKRMLYGPALIPDKEIMRLDENGEEYFVTFPRAVVEQLAQLFFKKNQHHNATFEHAFSVSGMTVVETWIKRGEQDTSLALGLSSALPEGTWFIGMKVDNDDVWNEVKAGKVKGFSIEGMFMDIGEKLSRACDEDRIFAELETLLKNEVQH